MSYIKMGQAVSIVGAVALTVFSQAKIVQDQASRSSMAAAAATALPRATSSGTATAKPAGAKVFDANCTGCHGDKGQGAPDVAPPLAKNPYVTGDPKKVIHTILYGLSGAVVEGKRYSGQMPAWKGQLSNADVAAVASYIRNSWGNSASTITEADVAKVKK